MVEQFLIGRLKNLNKITIKTSVVMNLSEGFVFSGRIKVQKVEPGLNCSAQDIQPCCKPYFMNSELSKFWAG